MSEFSRLQAEVARRYEAAFGQLPRDERVRDLLTRAAAIAGHSAPEQLRDSTGSLLASLFHLCTEKSWEPAELVAAALQKMDARPVSAPTETTEASRPRKIALLTGSFDPPGVYHRQVATQIRDCGFDEVIVRPGGPRADRPEPEHAASIHRAVLADLGFRGLPRVTVDLSDLDDRRFTCHEMLENRYADRGEVWHVISDEFVVDGRDGDSIVQTRWEGGAELWARSRFVIVHPPGSPPDAADLPPNHRLIPVDGHIPTADIRFRIFHGGADAADELITSEVAEYIRRHGLFASTVAAKDVRVRFTRPRIKIVTGPQAQAKALAERFRTFEDADPNLILVLGGDGTMLHAIRAHWRLRLPFLGLNAGHLGFLMNESLPENQEGLELLLYRMPMLRVDTENLDGSTSRAVAFSDAWIERESGQAAWLKVELDGRVQVPKVVGDGLLVATPAGSSSYARAMGATPVPLNAPVLTLAGSNVFRPRFWKPLALSDDSVVRLTSLDANGKRPVRCFLDGLDIGPVRSMEARVSTVAAVELAFTPEFDLSARLLRSLFPPKEDGNE